MRDAKLSLFLVFRYLAHSIHTLSAGFSFSNWPLLSTFLPSISFHLCLLSEEFYRALLSRTLTFFSSFLLHLLSPITLRLLKGLASGTVNSKHFTAFLGTIKRSHFTSVLKSFFNNVSDSLRKKYTSSLVGIFTKLPRSLLLLLHAVLNEVCGLAQVYRVGTLDCI